jgi:hypothetical protein
MSSAKTSRITASAPVLSANSRESTQLAANFFNGPTGALERLKAFTGIGPVSKTQAASVAGKFVVPLGIASDCLPVRSTRMPAAINRLAADSGARLPIKSLTNVGLSVPAQPDEPIVAGEVAAFVNWISCLLVGQNCSTTFSIAGRYGSSEDALRA